VSWNSDVIVARNDFSLTQNISFPADKQEKTKKKKTVIFVMDGSMGLV
jgi:hypothetical protein